MGGRGNITPEAFEKQIKSQYGAHADVILSGYPHSTDAEAAKASRAVRQSSSSWNTWTWARLQSQKGKGKAFEYIFDYIHTSPDVGSGHGSDVPYAFQTLSGGRGGAPKPEDLKLSDMISSYWVNFAKNGDPNGPGLPRWPAFAENDLKVMVFDATPSARPLPNLENVKVFDAYISWLRGQAKKSGGQ
jgi:para-nitrobenzyl esterase